MKTLCEDCIKCPSILVDEHGMRSFRCEADPVPVMRPGQPAVPCPDFFPRRLGPAMVDTLFLDGFNQTMEALELGLEDELAAVDNASWLRGNERAYKLWAEIETYTRNPQCQN